MLPIETENRNVAAVLDELNERLGAEGIEFGESSFSSLCHIRGESPSFERCRWLVCYPVRGSNEGWYVHIAEIGDPEERRATCRRHRLIATAKTWTADSAWQIARAAARHLDIT